LTAMPTISITKAAAC